VAPRIDDARRNRVDDIVIGARGAVALRQCLGSVSAQAVARAQCTVTVMRHLTGTARPEPVMEPSE
jgi:eukaryotic-like serine/threonine-protein kinase